MECAPLQYHNLRPNEVSIKKIMVKKKLASSGSFLEEEDAFYLFSNNPYQTNLHIDQSMMHLLIMFLWHQLDMIMEKLKFWNVFVDDG